MNTFSDEYIFANEDPYFAKGLRANLRYMSRKYLSCMIKEFFEEKLQPIDYLRFAKADIMSKNVHGSINSILNCKKAIHLLIDYIFKSMSLENLFLRMPFPKKIELIDKLEAIPTNLLQSLNKTRNIVEHEYATIEYKDALNFIEVTELFVRICYPMLRNMIFGSRIGLINSAIDYEWKIELDKSQISISECYGAPFEESENGPVYYNFDPKKEKRKTITEIKIQKENEADWLPYMNAFFYCTNTNMIFPDRIPYDNEKKEKHIKYLSISYI